MFRSERYAEISLSQWLALTPPALVREHLHLDTAMMGALRADEHPVVG